MQYLGGKWTVRKQIASILQPYVDRREAYYAPFVGGASVTSEIKGRRYASDNHRALISMWQAALSGFAFPERITEADYMRARDLPDIDPIKAFIGFGCSYSGKWFGGYARNANGRNYCLNAKRSLAKKAELMQGTVFAHCDFFDVPASLQGCVIYCDPPYVLTTGYATGPFNHGLFWERCQQLSIGCDVFVSEYTIPHGVGVDLLWEKEKRGGLKVRAGTQHTEKLVKVHAP